MMSTSQRRRPSTIDAREQRRHRPDYWLVMLATALIAIGLVVVYAISPGLDKNGAGGGYYVSKQFMAIGLSAVAFLAVANTPVQWWRKVEKPMIIAAAVAAVAVRLFGQRVNGAYRWIQFGGMSFQAVELIKFALLIWLAGFLSDRIRRGALNNYQQTLKPLMIVLGAIGAVVAVFQSDLGSTGVMVAMMAAMVFVAGMPLKRVGMIAGIVVIGTVLAVASSGYRRDRLLTYLHPERDCQNAGYQACQALIAVGSGGIAGLGLARSVQAYGYLPEAANDSIFAIIAEKFGFIGVTLLLAIYAAFFARLKAIAERAPDDYSRLIVMGILAWFSTQALINIGAMIGLLPIKGITLPFISYGGTSLLFVAGALGVAFNISRYTTFVPQTNQPPNKEGASRERFATTAVRYRT
ncbi:MAG: Stage sporulation protein [Candidatus Saccharibacteria bacterium]|nr:Stage sporulation protein [Candidatus Saccharibacteria bacterium]